MAQLSRRGALAGIGALGAASTLRPRRARAADPVTVWWNQGFYGAEDQAVINAMAAWERASGTKVNLTIMNGSDLISKLIAAMQVGDVPDLVHSAGGSFFLVPRAAWDDKLVDVSDVVETQKHEFHQTALDSSRFYNAALKKYSYYTIPIKGFALMEEAWRPMIEEAGFSDTDIPKTQDAYYNFFETVQDRLRRKGQRVYGLGYSMATKETDSSYLFHAFLVAYGGTGIVLPNGKLNIDDPTVKQAAVTALERLTTPFRKGYVPPSAINWGDVDNNNAFFAKQIVMTPNTTISIAVAQMEKADQYYKQIITTGIPDGNDGRPVVNLLSR
ncbi:MAG: ABC transporter substrate-binding protein [Rhodopila sp.]